MAPLRASLARSPPRLGRSQAGGLHPQTPRAAPPGAPSRTGPLLPRSPSRRGSGHGCDGGGGGQPLAVVHARRLAPPPLPWIQFFKSKATGAWASRRLVHRRASVPAAAAVGRPRHRPQGGCPPWVGSGVVHGQSGPTGQSASATRHPVPARRRRSALCRFIRENDSCEFGKNPALARARARLLVFFS